MYQLKNSRKHLVHVKKKTMKYQIKNCKPNRVHGTVYLFKIKKKKNNKTSQDRLK